MAKNEPIENSPNVREMSEHVHDYDKFIAMMKWGGIVCFIIGLIWVSIIKAYW